MYPFFRFIKTTFQAKKRSKIAFTEQSSIQFYCHPWDIDLWGEMNNGRVLTLYDIGRMDVAIRCNLDKALMKNRWALVVAGSSVRYRKRIKMFDKITMKTQCVGVDDKWFYLEQSMWVKEKPCSSVLIRAGITSKEGLVHPSQVASAIGAEYTEGDLPLWVTEWVDSEQHRPWPPTVD